MVQLLPALIAKFERGNTWGTLITPRHTLFFPTPAIAETRPTTMPVSTRDVARVVLTIVRSKSEDNHVPRPDRSIFSNTKATSRRENGLNAEERSCPVLQAWSRSR